MRGLLEVSVRPLDAYGDGLSETEMDWDSTLLYNKAKLYAERAHSEPVESALFALWMSLALELLARAALSRIHPVLLADPREQDNIHYVFWGGAEEHPEIDPSKSTIRTLFSLCFWTHRQNVSPLPDPCRLAEFGTAFRHGSIRGY